MIPGQPQHLWGSAPSLRRQPYSRGEAEHLWQLQLQHLVFGSQWVRWCFSVVVATLFSKTAGGGLGRAQLLSRCCGCHCERCHLTFLLLSPSFLQILPRTCCIKYYRSPIEHLSSFLTSWLPWFLPSLLPSFPASFLSSSLPCVLPSFLPSLPSLLCGFILFDAIFVRVMQLYVLIDANRFFLMPLPVSAGC